MLSLDLTSPHLQVSNDINHQELNLTTVLMLLLSFLKTSTKGKKGLASTNVKLMNPIIKYNMKNLLNVCLYPRIVNSIANISLSSKELLHSVYFIPV